MPEKPVKLNLNDKKQESLHDKIFELWKLKQASKKAKLAEQEADKSIKPIVSKFMEQEGYDAVYTSFYVSSYEGKVKKTAEKTVRLMRVVRRQVNFDADALEEKLGKDFCRNFIHRRYEITDWDGMVKLLKSYGIKPKEFLPFINVVKTVDTKALEQMEELGDITEDDIEGTYEVKELSNYLQIDECGAKNSK